MNTCVDLRVINENNQPVWVKQIDGKPRVSCMRYTYDIVSGNVPFAVPWGKIGYNGDVDAIEEDIWPVGGIYVDPTAEMGMEIYSSSDDDKDGGTGVTSVIVYYLTNTFVKKTEIKATNGTTAVALTATDIYRVNHFRAYTCGTAGVAVGNIDLRHLTDTPIYARLEAGYVRARQARWTVPKDSVLFISNIGGSVTNPGGGRSGTFTTKAKYDNLRNEKIDFFMAYHQKGVQDGEFNKDLDPPTRFTEGVDIKVSFKGDAGNADAIVHWSMRGWLENA